MMFKVARMREDGRRLKGGEKPSSFTGQLSILVEAAKRRDGHPRRMAMLWVSESVNPRRELCQPLFDPRIVSFDGNDLVLAGCEVNIDDATGIVRDTVQIWRCTWVGG